jgi:hypothetical protein
MLDEHGNGSCCNGGNTLKHFEAGPRWNHQVEFVVNDLERRTICSVLGNAIEHV